MKKPYLFILCSLLIISSYTAKAQNPNPDIAVALNHIGVYVTNLQTSTAFYENILSLKQIPEPFHDGKHTWFTIGKRDTCTLYKEIRSNTSVTGMITCALALNQSMVLSQISISIKSSTQIGQELRKSLQLDQMV